MIYLTFIGVGLVGNVNVGIVGLGVNVVVVGILEVVARAARQPQPVNEPALATAGSAAASVGGTRR